jgi:hypothetical protein
MRCNARVAFWCERLLLAQSGHSAIGPCQLSAIAGLMRCRKKRALFDHLVGARRAFETGLRRACFDLSDGGALGLTLRSGARIQLDLILLPHDPREMKRSTNRFHRSGCRLSSAHMKEAGDAPASSLVILLRIRALSVLIESEPGSNLLF